MVEAFEWQETRTIPTTLTQNPYLQAPSRYSGKSEFVQFTYDTTSAKRLSYQSSTPFLRTKPAWRIGQISGKVRSIARVERMICNKSPW